MRLRFGRSKPRAHYLHIGKTGGTAINSTLAPLVDAGRYQIVLDGHDVDLEQIPVGDKYFFVVRDPVDRFVSSFNDRQRCSRPRYDVGWTLEEERAYGIFHNPDALGRALSAGDESLRSAAQEAMNWIYHVRHTYWHWFRDPDYFRSRLDDLLYVMWLPNLSTSFRELCRLLELSPMELPSDDVGAHRDPGTASRFLSDEATLNLERWYASDFEFVENCSRLDRADPALSGHRRVRTTSR